MAHKILVTDDDPLLMALYKSVLKGLPGVEISYAPSLEEAWTMLKTERFEMALLDLNLTEAQNHEGLLLLRDLRRRQKTAVIMMSSECDEAAIAACVRNGATAFLAKQQGFARCLPGLVQQTLAA